MHCYGSHCLHEKKAATHLYRGSPQVASYLLLDDRRHRSCRLHEINPVSSICLVHVPFCRVRDFGAVGGVESPAPIACSIAIQHESHCSSSIGGDSPAQIGSASSLKRRDPGRRSRLSRSRPWTAGNDHRLPCRLLRRVVETLSVA